MYPVTVPSELMRKADLASSDETIRNVDLWRLAYEESDGSRGDRLARFRHALEHAHRLKRHRKFCGDCGARLR